MHQIRLFLLTVTFVVTASVLCNAECINSKAAFFFVNGIWTADHDAETTAIELESDLNDALELADDVLNNLRCHSVVNIAYNTTAGKIADLYESARTLGFVSDSTLATFRNILSHLVLTTYRPFSDYLVDRAISDVLDVHFDDPQSQESKDLADHVTKYRTALLAGKRVVIIAHSQGNLFANEAYIRLQAEFSATVLNRVHIVSVATPASIVQPGISPNPHTTLVDDFIHRVPLALDANVPLIDADESCGSEFDCHAFSQSYMTAILPRARILNKIKQALAPTARGDSFVVDRGQLLLVPVEQLTGNDEFLGTDSAATISFVDPLPDHFTQVNNGFAYVAAQDASGTVTVEYVIHSKLGTSNRARITIAIAIPVPINRPPTAAFSMSVPSQIAVSPGTLDVVADSVTGEARVTFQDQSTDSDGQIASRRWTTNTGCTPADPPPCVLSNGLATFTWGFKPGGPYIVTLTVTDNDGAATPVSATINVAAAAPTISDALPHGLRAAPNDQSVLFTGTGFQQGLTMSVGLPGGATSTLSGTQIQNVGPTSISALVTFGSPGTYTFTVVNPDGGRSAPLVIEVNPAAATPADLLSYQSSGYRYQIIGSSDAPPIGFEQSAFDDSTWSSGSAAFGTGAGCPIQASVHTPWPISTQLLVRRLISVPSGATGVQLKISVDNDIVGVFFNGASIGGPTTHENCPSLDDFTVQVPDGLVHAGPNLVALQLRDRGGESFFDMRVVATVSGTPTLAPIFSLPAGLAPKQVKHRDDGGFVVLAGAPGLSYIGTELFSVGGDGQLDWSISFPAPVLRLLFVDRGRVFLTTGATTITAVEAGRIVSGWPLTVVPLNAPVGSSSSIAGTELAAATGTVYVLVSSFGSQSSPNPGVVAALSRDGELRWRYEFPDSSSALGPVLGPDGNINLVSGNRWGRFSGPVGNFIKLDAQIGAQICSVATETNWYSFSASSHGVFSSLGADVRIAQPDCTWSTVFTSELPVIELKATSGDAIIGSAFDPFGGAFVPQFYTTGISTQNGLMWRRPALVGEILESPGWQLLALRDDRIALVRRDAFHTNVIHVFRSHTDLFVQTVMSESLCSSGSFRGADSLADGTLYIGCEDTGFIYRIDPAADRPNYPPAAAFSMTDGARSVLNGDVLNTFVDPVTGEVRVTLEDRSTDLDGAADIVAWEWWVSSQATPLCTGTQTCSAGFRPSGSIPYTVSLVARDRSGLASIATVTIIVATK